MKDSNYESPRLDVFTLSLEGNMCQTVSDYGNKWGDEQDWDE